MQDTKMDMSNLMMARAVALLLVANSAAAFDNIGVWRRLADMPAARQEMPAIHYAGKIYVPGGMDADLCCNALGKFEVYDIAADLWTALPDVPILANHMGGAALNGKIYVLGGWMGGTDAPASNKAFAYDISAGTWSNLPDMPEGAAGPGVVLYGGRIYVFGGSTQSAFDKDGSRKVKEYDPATNAWTTVNSDMPFGRCHIGAGLIGTKVYISPGRPGRVSRSDDDVVQEFDFTKMNQGAAAWRVMNPMPSPTRTGYMSSWPVVNGKLYYIGGEGNYYSVVHTTVHEFTPDAGGGTYREVNPYPLPTHGIGPVAVDGKIYVCGGASSGGVGSKQKVLYEFQISGIPPAVPPAAPGALTAPTPTGTAVQLSWADNSIDETGFTIERRSGGGAFQQIAQTGAGIALYSDAGQESASYTYRVRAYNAAGPSAYSNELTVAIPPDLTPPAISAVLAVSSTTVRVTFSEAVTAVSAGTASNYSITNGTTISSAVLQPDQRTVALTVAGLVSGVVNTLSVNGVRDASVAGNFAYTSAAFTWLAWLNQDIGSVAAAGSMTSNATSFTVAGSGADIYGIADEFQFVYRPLSGNGEIVARVVSQGQGNPYSKAGVMIREKLTAGSKHASVCVTPGNGVEFNSRVTEGGTSNNPILAGAAAPYWVKMVRSGTTLTGSASPDGATWTVVSTRTISMATDVFIGMAVTSHNDGQIHTAVFANVAVIAYAAPLPPVNPSASATSGSTLSIAWNDASNNEASFLVQRTGNPAGPWTDLPMVAANVTATTDSGLAPSTQYFYRVRALNAYGNSAFSAMAADTTLRVVDDWLSARGMTTAELSLDPDRDGLAVGVEYALGLEPDAVDSGKAPALSLATGSLALVFTRPKPVPAGLAYVVEVSRTLQIWNSGDAFTWPAEVTDNLDGTETVTVRSRTAPGGAPAEFIRLTVVFD